MEKSFLFMSIAGLMLLLAPQLINADDCQFTPNLFPGQAADRTELEINATVTVGEGAIGTPRYGQISDLASSNTAIVSAYSGRGYGVYFVGAGNADVTYTETVRGRESTCSTDHIIHYTVNKGTPVADFANTSGTTYSEYNFTLSTGGDAGGGADGSTGSSSVYYYGPTPQVKIKELITNLSSGVPSFRDLAVTTGLNYNSTNTNVAEISSTGAISINGTGVTTLSVSWAGDENWNAVSASLVLTVKKRAYFYFNPQSYTDTVGNKTTRLPINAVSGIRWTSDAPTVASVDENTGEVTMLGKGKAIISAILDENDEYFASNASYELNVVKKSPQLSFDEISLNAEVGVPFTPPTFHNPFNVPINKWNSQNPDIADVSEDGSVVTIKAEGDAYIFCESYETSDYAAQSVAYTVHVISTGVTICGVLVNSLNSDDILNDGNGSVTYEETSVYRTVTLKDAILDGGGAQTAIVDSKGGIPLRVKMDGNCEIKNVQTAISAPSAVLIWGENKNDTLTINATGTAIQSQAVKIHDSYVFATGVNYGIHCLQGLSVSAGGYIFAQATGTNGVAIYVHPSYGTFTKGEGGIGGIQIMTRGVFFRGPEDTTGPKGFYWDDKTKKTPVQYIEIGKVPLPIANDVQTNISFVAQEDNPEENLRVVFSKSEDDTFNEAEKRLELSTTASDAAVEQALTDYVTCSSDWKKEMPGTLVFDVPEGEGQVEIDCKTEDGYDLAVKVEGADGVTTVTQPNDNGTATVSYNVDEQTHVIVYLRGNGATTAPARRVANSAGQHGAYIKSITITPKNAPTALENTKAENKEVKVLFNGKVYICRDGKIFDTAGVRVK